MVLFVDNLFTRNSSFDILSCEQVVYKENLVTRGATEKQFICYLCTMYVPDTSVATMYHDQLNTFSNKSSMEHIPVRGLTVVHVHVCHYSCLWFVYVMNTCMFLCYLYIYMHRGYTINSVGREREMLALLL